MITNKRAFLAILVMGIGLTSCLKSKSNNNQNNPSAVAFINVSPSMPTFAVLLDNDSVGSNVSFPYLGYKLALNTTDSALFYTSVYAGIHYIAFNDSTVKDTSTYAAGNIQFANNTKYSVYLFDTVNNYGLNAIQIQDSYDSIPLAVPTSAVRFLNFCGDSVGLDVTYNDTILWYSNFLFIGNGSASAATLSQYTDLPAGRYVFNFFQYGSENFMLNPSGSGLINYPHASPFDSVAIITQPQKAYTILVSGFFDSTSGPKVFRHFIVHMN